VHPDVRIARGCLLAVTSAVLSVTAHTVADGALPPLSVALVIAGLTGWTSTALVDRTKGTRSGRLIGVLVTLAAAQLITHGLLTLLAHPQPTGGTPIDGWAMLAAHASATVIMAVLITGAERGLLAVLAGLRRILPVIVTFGPPRVRAVRCPAAPATPATYTEILLRRVHSRRGPPHRS